MTWISLAAVFFIAWWLMLFVSLPFGLRTQDDEDDVVLGTESSAPRGPHMLRAMIRTTVLTVLLIGAYYTLTAVLGFGFEDIPRIVPDF
ncbi:DUF1467 family protein [Chelativorans sp. M5D2P16]|uniref:DUF1467 family protein n=1 Tax=Chelativorans sp. M5D2P16 TaxID=3095678 RepID=UPI002ACA9DA5|nr:DUF1467 family protein [Chelativorans sp. M5D2P16]MDZ5696943.1 DUF1467 family protein [Chelativorans sp. M5D2P16]